MDEELQGTWLDKRTGNTIIVDDAIMDGEDMLIKTSIGIINGDVFANNFIKMSEECYETTGLAPAIDEKNILNTINQQLDSDMKIEKVETPVITTTKTPIVSSSSNTQVAQYVDNINNESLIDKVFKKKHPNITMTFNIQCDNLPVTELKMLSDMFDVSIDDITNYIIKHYINDYIKSESIFNQCKDYISSEYK